MVEAWFWHNTGRLKPGSGRLRNLPGSTLSDLRPKSRGLAWLKGCGAPVLENGLDAPGHTPGRVFKEYQPRGKNRCEFTRHASQPIFRPLRTHNFQFSTFKLTCLKPIVGWRDSTIRRFGTKPFFWRETSTLRFVSGTCRGRSSGARMREMHSQESI